MCADPRRRERRIWYCAKTQIGNQSRFRRGLFLPSVEKHRDRVSADPFMGKIDGLAGLANKIGARLAIKPEIFIIHPAELRILRLMSDQDLCAFAAENGWRVVRRLGGRQIEFYNDASQRVER